MKLLTKIRLLIITLCLLVVPFCFSAVTELDSCLLSLGKQVLLENDGWASFEKGTTGGSNASEENIYVVKTKDELLQALKGDMANNIPKIIFIEGTIKINEPYEKYKDPEFDLEKYLDEYSPENWGKKEVTGPLEEARKRSQQNQAKDIVIYIGSNTSLIGVGRDAKISGAALQVKGVENVIIRNITFESPVDYFPAWDPNDGEFGEWNSEYDCLTIENSKNVWVDHCTFSDGDYLDNMAPVYFGRLFQQHDGLLDIKNEADLITISYNIFYNHDKTMLIGSSDSRIQDRGHLRVTLHHNLFENVTQRLPRVRFGQVHVYNNYYKINSNSPYYFDYAWGVGVESQIYAQNNFIDLPWNISVANIIKRWKGNNIYEEGNVVCYPASEPFYVNILKAHNDVNVNDKLISSVEWTPTMFNRIDPAISVPAIVLTQAGAGKLY